MNDASNEEIIRYDLGEDFLLEAALVVGELYRHNGEWRLMVKKLFRSWDSFFCKPEFKKISVPYNTHDKWPAIRFFG